AQKALENYGREVALCRQYFNVIQEMKGTIRVYCRVRPLLQNDSSSEMSVEFVDECTLRAYNPEEVQMNNINNSQARCGKNRNKTLEFDKDYQPNATQEQVFEDTKQLVTSVLDGYNVCIFEFRDLSLIRKKNNNNNINKFSFKLLCNAIDFYVVFQY
ncbi:hypothetical protein RFI_36390, partial [Reticulomyxa filosa]